MNYPPLSFCKEYPSTGDYIDVIDNIIKYYASQGSGKFPQKYIKIIYNGLGLHQNSRNFELSTFYSFWGIEENINIMGLIISQVTADTNLGKNSSYYITRKYNNYILQIFFCNQIPYSETFPKIGKVQHLCEDVKENIYQYLKGVNLGGRGLQPDPLDPKKKSIMYNLCQGIIPSNIDQSLYISTNQDIYKWCGCYVTPSNFSAHFGDKKDDNVCNPLCSHEKTIKRFKNLEDSMVPMEEGCYQTICAIDSISIRSFNNEGTINFTQICPGCKDGGNCTCIVDSSVQGILDKIISGEDGTQNPATFKQVCPNANCFLSEPDGSYKKLTCNTNNSANTNKDPLLGYSGNGFLRNLSDVDKFTTTNYTVFIFFCLLFIFFILISFMSMVEIKFFEYKNKNKTVIQDNSTPVYDKTKPYGNPREEIHNYNLDKTKPLNISTAIPYEEPPSPYVIIYPPPKTIGEQVQTNRENIENNRKNISRI